MELQGETNVESGLSNDILMTIQFPLLLPQTAKGISRTTRALKSNFENTLKLKSIQLTLNNNERLFFVPDSISVSTLLLSLLEVIK